MIRRDKKKLMQLDYYMNKIKYYMKLILIKVVQKMTQTTVGYWRKEIV